MYVCMYTTHSWYKTDTKRFLTAKQDDAALRFCLWKINILKFCYYYSYASTNLDSFNFDMCKEMANLPL